MAKKLPKVAFLGTGLMGFPMSCRLVSAEFPVTVWNRTAAKAAPLAEQGAKVAETPIDAVRDADIVITMLTDGAAVSDALFDEGAADAMRPGTLVIDMSSIKPIEARAHAKRLAKRSIGHLDAPVSGGTLGAVEGALAIMVGGEEADFERAQPVLAVLGRATLVGPSGAGQLAKLANQAIVAINIGGVAEALLLAAAGGADPAAVRDAIRGGFAESRILEVHGERMIERNFVPGGQIKVHIKDLNNILDAAHEAGLRLPISQTLLELMKAVRDELNGGGYDHSAVLLALEQMSDGRRVGAAPDRLPKA